MNDVSNIPAGTILKNLLLQASDDQLDASVFPLIEKWDDKGPTPIQVLEVLDKCTQHSLASGPTMQLLGTVYELTLADYNMTHDEVVKQATWRTETGQ